MLEITVFTERGESTFQIEDTPFSEAIPISAETGNQLVELVDGLYVPLPYKTPVVQEEGLSKEAVLSQDAATRSLEEIRSSKVDKMVGYSLVSNEEQDRLSTVASGATANSTDEQLRNRATHTGEQPINTVTGLPSALESINTSLDSKVDKVIGKGLSKNDFTDSEKDKLASLESSRFKGVFTSLDNLIAGVDRPKAGDYAQVDRGVGNNAVIYIYDRSDGEWLEQKSATTLTASQVKELYEQNPNTEAFTTAFRSKLEGMEVGATRNATDAQLRDRTTHTGVQPISSITELRGELDNRVKNNDPRLSDAREWTAPTVSEAIASAGEDTRRWAWTAQRIKQLVLGWWGGVIVQTSGEGTDKVMSQKATKDYMEGNLGDIQSILDEINEGEL